MSIPVHPVPTRSSILKLVAVRQQFFDEVDMGEDHTAAAVASQTESVQSASVGFPQRRLLSAQSAKKGSNFRANQPFDGTFDGRVISVDVRGEVVEVGFPLVANDW